MHILTVDYIYLLFGHMLRKYFFYIRQNSSDDGLCNLLKMLEHNER